MPITTTPARLRAAVVAALAVSALGAGAATASAAQTISIGDAVVQEGSHGAGGKATFTLPPGRPTRRAVARYAAAVRAVE